MATRPFGLLLAVSLLTGCSGGSDDADDGATLGDTRPPTAVTAPDAPAPSLPRTGAVVVGGSTSSFSITECRLDPAGDADPLLVATGAGTTPRGDPFRVEVVRFAAETGAAETFTDTITYTDTARILQLQRFEVAGAVTDIRDPRARSTLLRVRPDGLSASGLAGPPGTGGDDADGNVGIVGLALDLTC